MANVTFIGLGVMGWPMARHLAQNGHALTVYNRTTEKARQWVAENGGRVAGTPRAAAESSEFVFSCVGNDDDLRSIAVGDDGALAGMMPGAIYIDNTTASSIVARELAAVAAEHGVGFLDAPVSGGQAGAEAGQLTVMIGGDEATFQSAKAVIDSFARIAVLMGPTGSGQLTKMVNQICIAGVLEGLAEGIHFAQKTGLDVEKVMAVITKGAAQSWQMENCWNTMKDGKFDFGFAVEWMRKDLSICLNTARVNGAQLPVTALVDQFYAEVTAMGGRRWDTSSLLARLAR